MVTVSRRVSPRTPSTGLGSIVESAETSRWFVVTVPGASKPSFGPSVSQPPPQGWERTPFRRSARDALGCVVGLFFSLVGERRGLGALSPLSKGLPARKPACRSSLIAVVAPAVDSQKRPPRAKPRHPGRPETGPKKTRPACSLRSSAGTAEYDLICRCESYAHCRSGTNVSA